MPQLGSSVRTRLHKAFENEFLQIFGGCTVIRNIKGFYAGGDGKTDEDTVNLVNADTPFDFDQKFEALSEYSDQLRLTAMEASGEEAVLVVVHGIYHSL
ncbi:MAG: hypothetical protein ABI539_12960 [Acidobacteriota bacterium]